MKLLMLIGGFVGFLIGMSFGFAQRSTWPTVILNASAGTLAAGFLMRWWGRVWMRGLGEVLLERQKAALAAQAKNKQSPLAQRRKL